MATWQDIVDQMNAHYTVHRATEDAILVELTLNSGRTQTVSILLEEQFPGYPIVGIVSPFADLTRDTVDLRAALSSYTQVVGLAIQSQRMLGYVWSWPLQNIDATDLHVVLRLLVNHADGQERMLLGKDSF